MILNRVFISYHSIAKNSFKISSILEIFGKQNGFGNFWSQMYRFVWYVHATMTNFLLGSNKCSNLLLGHFTRTCSCFEIRCIFDSESEKNYIYVLIVFEFCYFMGKRWFWSRECSHNACWKIVEWKKLIGCYAVNYWSRP